MTNNIITSEDNIWTDTTQKKIFKWLISAQWDAAHQ